MERPSGFDDDDDDDHFAGAGGKRGTSGHKEDLTVKADGENGGADHRPTTPRSKHSATEQRRRSKINDRFQMLRELIPHNDQKRDKASFLLEVIEYIRFLQEKVQKNESSYPEWTEENAKLMPWVKAYFRSFWKNARNDSQVPGDGIVDPSQEINCSVPSGFIFSGNDDNTPVATGVLSVGQSPSASVSYKDTGNPSGFANEGAPASVPQPNLYDSVGRVPAQPQQLISDAENMVSLSQSPWLRSSPPDCTVTSDMLNEQEEYAIDEGTISISSACSQGWVYTRLLTTLSQALQTSGIDLSQATLSVEISLGKRATNRTPTVTTSTSSAKDHHAPSSCQKVTGHSKVGSSGRDSEPASKRHKSKNS